MKRFKGQRQEERREKEQEKEPVRCMWSQVHYQPVTRLHTKAEVTALMKKSYGINVLVVTYLSPSHSNSIAYTKHLMYTVIDHLSCRFSVSGGGGPVMSFG